MGNIIDDFNGTNLGLILIILGIFFGLQQFIEYILKPMFNQIAASFGSYGIIIIIGIIIWLFQKHK